MTDSQTKAAPERPPKAVVVTLLVQGQMRRQFELSEDPDDVEHLALARWLLRAIPDAPEHRVLAHIWREEWSGVR